MSTRPDTALKADHVPALEGACALYNEGQVIATSAKPVEEILFTGDAVREAIANDFVKQISTGQWTYLQQAANIVRAFHGLLRQYVAAPLGYEEWILPRLQTREAIQNFGWEARENLMGELMRVVPNVPERGEHLPEFYYLDPLQCPSFYRHMALESPLDINNTPIRVFEVMGGWTYRNEQPERISRGFQTGLEFMGAEMVFLGEPEAVSQTRLDTLKAMITMLNDLGIVWRLTVGGSCCHSDSQQYADILDSECRMEQIPTMDIECFVPFTGEWVELGGGDLAYTRLAENFNISFGNSDKEVWSGCQGMGFGRSMYIFLSQFGCDPSKWPSTLTDQF